MQKQLSAGFTLVELMIALSVVAILAIVTIPSFKSSIKNNRAVSQTNSLLSALALARNEAIRRNARVVVCSSVNQTSCAGSTNWATGWIVFLDADNNDDYSLNTDPACSVGTDHMATEDCLIRTYQALKGNATLTSTGNFTRYNSSGTANSIATYTLKPEDCNSNEQLALTINLAGRAYSKKEVCS